jgi:predicted aldo/keto reductase-like oxidoreductase
MASLDRREFLRRSAAAGFALSLPALSGAGADEPPRVRRRAVLGRTGLSISDIGFGSSRLAGDEALVRHALERGIDYFDTAESYADGASEETLGRALRGVRDKVTIASKVSCETSYRVADLFRALDGSLRRLQTDRIDIYFNHAVNDVARLRNPEWTEFTARAKKQGKIRFTGMSGHGGRLCECLDYAFDHDLVDVVLVGHNYGQDPAFYQRFTASLDFIAMQRDLPRLLAKAKQKNVGVIAMKTLRGARLNDLRAYERAVGTFAQAAFRWVLSRPHVDGLIVSMTSQEQVDEYLVASGAARVTRGDLLLLARYEQRNGATQCRYGCGACLSSCPEDVPIDAVLRTRMYAEDYGAPELARAEYAALGSGAEACIGCSHRACTGACPHGIDISSLTAHAHRILA